MKTAVLVIFLMLIKWVAGQASGQLEIPAGTMLSEVLTPDKLYQHPQFTLGKVFYRNGTETEAFLNYNNLRGDIEFIGPKKDTLIISTDLLATIKKIVVNGRTYVYKDRYYEQVAENNFGKLLKRQVYMVVDRQRLGAYDQYSSLSSISSFANFRDAGSGALLNLQPKEKTTLALRSEYFFGDKNDSFLPASKKNLIKSFPFKKSWLEDYLEKHPVDYKNMEDLKQLFSSM